MNLPDYRIARAPSSVPFRPDWNGPEWVGVPVAEVAHFLPESSSHRPRTTARLMHDPEGIHGIFEIHDQYVRCVRTGYFDEVWKDSCVEFFVEPVIGNGYFNFEFNCGGAFLCSHITDPQRTPSGFKSFTKIPFEIGRQVRVSSSLPARVDPEVTEPTTWHLRFFVPFALLQHYSGPFQVTPGSVWRGNFYKCAEDVSHPHWAAWSPVDCFNFHRPQCFGRLAF